MKLKKQRISKSLILSFFIIASMIFPLMSNFSSITNSSLTFDENNDGSFITSVNGKQYLAKYITNDDIEEMKLHVANQPDQSASKSTLLIDDHGTGYKTPSVEDLESLVGKVSLLEDLPDNGQKYQASADLSSEIYFPVVGNQEMQGSCSAWANAYYAYGYLEAKDYGWDASSGNPDYLLSPAWAYNIVTAYDIGSVPYEVVQVLLDWGVPTLSAMPYDDSDVNSWGNETAWRQAPYHRPLDYDLITYTGTATIDLIKSLIDGGTPVTIGIDASQFNNGLDQGTSDFILSSTEYIPDQGLNHAQCLVGYDDDVSEGSDVGAFRVVNSWGDTWMDNGYYWLTYDAFAELADDYGQVLMYITDRIDYNPDLIATWEFSSTPTRMDDIMSLGVGPHYSPLDSITPLYDGDPNNEFPDFMALDLSDFFPDYIANNSEFFFLEIGSSTNNGIISSFLIERYTAGVLDEITHESIDVPQSTPGYVRNTFMEFDHEIGVTLETPMNPELSNSYLINATVTNNGLNDESNIELYLYLDDGLVNSATYSTLSSGASETINYLWTPITTGNFNITAFSPPIAGEFSENNNRVERLIGIHPIKLFDGMVLEYSFAIFGSVYSFNSLYSDLLEGTFHNDYSIYDGGSSVDMGYWNVGSQTRLISDSSGGFAFGSGTHTPLWIFTDIGIGEDIPISVDAEGDHLFSVTGDSIYDLPGFGLIEVWKLEDLTQPGGIAWYEKSTGILLNGKFYYNGGMYNYTFEFVDTNALFEYVILDHELRVSLETPINPELGSSYLINATVTNNGLYDESNVELYLYLDDGVVNSITYPTLTSGASETINYLWTPTTYATFNFTVFSPAVVGEIFETNNFLSSLITVELLLNYTMTAGYPYTWIDASSGEELYLGDDDYAAIPLPFVFEFYGQEFSNVYLCSNGYLSFSDDMPTEYSNVPFPSGNALDHYMIAPFWDDLYPSGGYIYVESFGDHWVAEWQDIYHFNGPLLGSFEVVLYDTGDIVFNYDYLDYTSGGYTCGLNLGVDTRYYNYYQGLSDSTDDFSLQFTRQLLDHDLSVSLEIPMNPEIGNSYMINATVKNIGLNDEYAVALSLYLDDVEVASSTIPTLNVEMEQMIQYTWTANDYCSHNFTAIAPPVPNELYAADNTETKFVQPFQSIFFDDFESGLTKWQSNTGLWHLTDTGSLWPDPCHSPIHSMWFGDESTGTFDTGYREFGELVSIPFSLAGFSSAVLEFYHWREGESGFDMSFVYVSTNGIDWDEIYSSDASYIAPWQFVSLDLSDYLGYPSVQLKFYFDTYDSISNDYRGWLLDDIQVKGIRIDQDLSVTLETPMYPEIDNSYIINATVTNNGLNDEFNVELFLYMDGGVVNSITYPTLTSGASETINFLWTPTEYGSYNFTTYAPPVPLESYLDNNQKTNMLAIFETDELFNGLFIQHYFTQSMDTAISSFKYQFLNARMVEVTFELEYLGSHMFDTWTVDATTRIISGSLLFGNSIHTPAWIFTSTSLYDTIPIAVDSEGDHMFNVTRDLIYDLPGYGPIAVWVLEDLTMPGGVAWYEKSTGILLNSTFLYSTGSYQFDFIDTNAKMTIVAPPDDFNLTSNAGDPDEDGKFDLTWTESLRADNYSIYQYPSYITEVNGSLTVLADEITDLTLGLSKYQNGTYYFIVVSHNYFGDTISNCIEINVAVPPIPPDDFTLSSNAGDPDTDGNFYLLWTEAFRAYNYSIYSYSNIITNINGSLILLADEVEGLNLAQIGYLNGTYYFIVVAHNNYGDTLSNCIEITVSLPALPGNFILSSTADDPDTDGSFDLDWTESERAITYSIYRHSSFITEINGDLTLLADGITDLNLALNGYQNGDYYFIIVAHNEQGDTLSNCIKVKVQKPNAIPGYDMLLLIIALGVVSSLILKKKLKIIAEF